MSQQWEYRTARIWDWDNKRSKEDQVNAALAQWAAQGWDLVNVSYGLDSGTTFAGAVMWLFWRRAK